MVHPPGRAGLYDPRFEHDSCGVSFVAHIKGVASHELVLTGLRALTRTSQHRGATGAESDTGDGAGILTQIPDRFLRAVFAEDHGIELPAPGHYAVGIAFLPSDPDAVDKAKAAIEDIMSEQGLAVVGWRVVPIEPSCLGVTSRAAMPSSFQQLVVRDADAVATRPASSSTGWCTSPASGSSTSSPRSWPPTSRRSRRARSCTRACSPRRSSRRSTPTSVDERFESALLLVHSRFSTNTFPSWPLAHPYRFVAHNGEINTVQGNENWMRAREAMLRSPHLAQPRAGVPDLHAGRVRHRPLRRGARAAPPRRALAATTRC